MDWLLNPWLLYALVVLAISGTVGLHLGKFRAAYTEMTGMMAGMTMGMLNGFMLGYAAAAYFNNMFWGNLFGILLGLALGVYFGRPGGLMGIMDGGMGGVMGGSMGAMLAMMIIFPREALLWTAVLLAAIYIAGILGLVVLIERSDLRHAALHRTLPWLARAMRDEAGHIADDSSRSAHRQSTNGKVDSTARLADYYTLLGVSRSANPTEIGDAYLSALASSTSQESAGLERAFAILSDPQKKAAYDRSLPPADGPGDCCPPPRKKAAPAEKVVAASAAKGAGSVPVRTSVPSAKHTAVNPQRTTTQQQARKAQPQRASSKRQANRKSESPISWIGGMAIGVAVVALAAWWIAGGGRPASSATNRVWEPKMGHVSPPVERAQLDAQAVSAVVGEDGVQTLDFVVNGDNMAYRPNVIKVKNGVPARLNISTEGRDPGCGRFVGFKGLGSHAIAEPGQTVTMDFTPAQAGVYEINCNMDMMQPGYLIVE
jgi:plastocyanin